jgi:hypothetical protein
MFTHVGAFTGTPAGAPGDPAEAGFGNGVGAACGIKVVGGFITRACGRNVNLGGQSAIGSAAYGITSGAAAIACSIGFGRRASPPELARDPLPGWTTLAPEPVTGTGVLLAG